jgi:hypothetical protein
MRFTGYDDLAFAPEIELNLCVDYYPDTIAFNLQRFVLLLFLVAVWLPMSEIIRTATFLSQPPLAPYWYTFDRKIDDAQTKVISVRHDLVSIVSWRQLVEQPDGSLDRKFYTFCVLER